jgi:hypothetical protein
LQVSLGGTSWVFRFKVPHPDPDKPGQFKMREMGLGPFHTVALAGERLVQAASTATKPSLSTADSTFNQQRTSGRVSLRTTLRLTRATRNNMERL